MKSVAPAVHCTVDEDGVAWIVFDNPGKLNALTTRMLDHDLPEACARVAADPEIRGAVLIGEGRAFCSGADVGDRLAFLATAEPDTIDRPLGGFVLHVARLPKPVVAAINGTVAGGGLALAAVADRRIALDGARLVAGYGARGLVPDGGLTYTLPLLDGRAPARRKLVGDESLDAAAALELGLVDRVVATVSELRAVAAAAVASLGGKGDEAARSSRELIAAGFVEDLERHIERESEAQWERIRDPRFRERLDAFLEDSHGSRDSDGVRHGDG